MRKMATRHKRRFPQFANYLWVSAFIVMYTLMLVLFYFNF
jgi:hypothetical protein